MNWDRKIRSLYGEFVNKENFTHKSINPFLKFRYRQIRRSVVKAIQFD